MMRELLMDKGLSVSALVVAVLILLIFSLDLSLKVPFGRANWVLDVGFVICAAIVAVLSFFTYREIK